MYIWDCQTALVRPSVSVRLLFATRLAVQRQALAKAPFRYRQVLVRLGLSSEKARRTDADSSGFESTDAEV